MEALDRLIARVADDQDDVLVTLQLVQGDAALEAHLFDRLVGLLVEGLFLDLRRQRTLDLLDDDGYLAELALLAEACRDRGLLPFPSRTA